MERLKTYWWQIGLMVIGGVLMIGGLVVAKQQTQGKPVEILEIAPSPSATQAQLVVDVAGAVQKPGVYRLPQGARVGEAIIAAGGLAAKADRSYVARFMNQAELIKDGMKLFIPEEGDPTTSAQGGLRGASSSMAGIISINTASEAELDSLWGIGAARAKTIIQNRPYSSLDELVTKAKITQDVLDKNQGKIGL